MSIDRNTLLHAAVPPVPVEVAGLGTVYIAVLSATEAIKLSADSKAAPADAPVTDSVSRLLVRTLVDSEGNRLLTDDDIPALALRPHAIYKALSNAAMSVNSLGDDAKN